MRLEEKVMYLNSLSREELEQEYLKYGNETYTKDIRTVIMREIIRIEFGV